MNNPNLFNEETNQVNLTSKAGGMITRTLVKKGEELIKETN